jgi:hypothetical protein
MRMIKIIRLAFLAVGLIANREGGSAKASGRQDGERADQLPAANFVRFSRVDVQVPFASYERRRLGATAAAANSDASPSGTSVTVLIEEGVVRACGR